MNSLVLPALIPLLTAPLLVLIGGRHRAWLMAFISLGAALLSVVHLFSLGDSQNALGGWAAPVGITYVIDAANRPILLLIMLAGLLGLLCAPPERLAWLESPRPAIFYALYCLCVSGLAGIASTGDAFNVFVFLEISSLATYALVAAGPGRKALRAAFQYLVLGTLGGSFVLLGVGMLYMATGSLNMADIAALIPASPLPNAVLVGGAFVLLGFMLKSALFPLHQWLPGAYSRSPNAVAVLLAGSGTKVSLYALSRIMFGVFGVSWLVAHQVDKILLILACAAMLFGSLGAIQQTRLKALLAWSSIAQIGYIVLGISTLSEAGLRAAWVFMLFHAVIKGGLFVCASGLPSDRLENLPGLAQRDPLRAACMTLLALALLGVPLTAGFVSKWLMLQAAWDSGALLGVIVFAVSSLLAVAYVARIVLPIWQHSDNTQPIITPPTIRLAMLLTTAAALIFGVWPGPVIELCQRAAEALL